MKLSRMVLVSFIIATFGQSIGAQAEMPYLNDESPQLLEKLPDSDWAGTQAKMQQHLKDKLAGLIEKLQTEPPGSSEYNLLQYRISRVRDRMNLVVNAASLKKFKKSVIAEHVALTGMAPPKTQGDLGARGLASQRARH